MQQINLFIELTRLKKPIGYMLLFWPCAWGLTIAYDISANLNTYFFYIIESANPDIFKFTLPINFLGYYVRRTWCQQCSSGTNPEITKHKTTKRYTLGRI